MNIFKRKQEEVERINLYEIVEGLCEDIVHLEKDIKHPTIDHFVVVHINDDIVLALLPTGGYKVSLKGSNITLWQSYHGFCPSLVNAEKPEERIFKLLEALKAKDLSLRTILKDKESKILEQIDAVL